MFRDQTNMNLAVQNKNSTARAQSKADFVNWGEGLKSHEGS